MPSYLPEDDVEAIAKYFEILLEIEKSYNLVSD